MPFLIAAILLEVAATACLKYSDGFSKLWPSFGILTGYGLSFALLAQAIKTMEVSVAYAVWAGVGTALITIIAVVALGESVGFVKILGIGLIVGGVVALNLGGSAS